MHSEGYSTWSSVSPSIRLIMIQVYKQDMCPGIQTHPHHTVTNLIPMSVPTNLLHIIHNLAISQVFELTVSTSITHTM